MQIASDGGIVARAHKALIVGIGKIPLLRTYYCSSSDTGDFLCSGWLHCVEWNQFDE